MTFDLNANQQKLLLGKEGTPENTSPEHLIRRLSFTFFLPSVLVSGLVLRISAPPPSDGVHATPVSEPAESRLC